MGFQKWGVPLNYPFQWDFRLETIHFGVSPILGNPHNTKKKENIVTLETIENSPATATNIICCCSIYLSIYLSIYNDNYICIYQVQRDLDTNIRTSQDAHLGCHVGRCAHLITAEPPRHLQPLFGVFGVFGG